MTYEIIEYYDGQRTVLDTTDCPHDAECIRRWHMDQWACQATAAKCVRVETKRA